MENKPIINKPISEVELRYILIVGIGLIVLLSISTISYFNFLAANKSLNFEIETTVNTLAFSRANQVTDLLRASLDVVQSTAELDVLQDNLEDIVVGVNVIEATNAIKETIEDINDKTNTFYRMKVIDKNGIVVATTESDSRYDETGDDVSDRNYFIEGLRRSYIGDAYKSSTDNIEQIPFAAPIITDRSTVPNGVLVIHQAFDNILNAGKGLEEGLGINSITLNRDGLGISGEVYIINKDKLMITPSIFLENTFLKQEVDTKAFENCRIGKKVGGSYPDYRGISVIGNSEPIKGTSWCIVAEVDSDEAFAPNQALRNTSLFLGVIFLLLSFVGSFLLSKFITNPLSILTADLDKITKGEFNVQLKPSKIKEIQSLTNSLNRVLTSLKLAILRTSKPKPNAGLRKKQTIKKKIKEIK